MIDLVECLRKLKKNSNHRFSLFKGRYRSRANIYLLMHFPVYFICNCQAELWWQGWFMTCYFSLIRFLWYPLGKGRTIDVWYTCIHTYIHTCLLWLISMLWHRQAIFESKGDKLSSSAECMIRTQGLRHLFASRLNACWQTDWAIEVQAKLELDSPSLWSASIQPTRPHCQLAFAPGSGDIHVCCC